MGGWAALDDEAEAAAPAPVAPAPALAPTSARLLNRLALCIAALCLLWLTSLPLAALVTDSLVPPPALADALGACVALRDGAQVEREAHLACAELQAGEQCAADLVSARTAAQAAADAARAANGARLEALHASADGCERARGEARGALRRMAEAGLGVERWLPAAQPGACDAAARDAVAAEADAAADAAADGDGALAADAQAMSRAAAAERVALMAALEARAAYDRDYLAAKAADLAAAPAAVRAGWARELRSVELKIGAQLPLALLRCATLAGGEAADAGACVDGASAAAAVSAALDALASAYEGAVAQAEATDARARSLGAAASAELARAEAVLARLRGLEAALAAAGFSLGALPPPLGALPPLPALELPELSANVRAGDLAALLPPAAAGAAAAVEASVRALPAAAAAAAASAFEAAASGWLDGLPDFLSDYEPPSLLPARAAQARADAADARAAGALQRVRAALANPRGAAADGPWRNASERAGAAPERATSAADAGRADATRAAEPFELPDVREVTAWLSRRVASLGHAALGLDCAARALASARVVAHFVASGGAADGTALDVRPAGVAVVGAAAGVCGALVRASPALLLARALTSPLAWLVLGGSLAVLISMAAASAWAGAFGAFEAGCATAAGDGGVLGRNAYALAFDWAAQDGDAQLARALGSHARERAAACAELGASGADGRAPSAQAEADTLARRAVEASRALGALRACALAPPAAAELRAADAGAAERALAELRAALRAAQCPEPAAVTAGARLAAEGVACDQALPPCAPTCSGPSRQLLRALARRCGCFAEFGAHTHLARALLVVASYAALNVARALLLGGLGRLWWRELFSGAFEFVGACDIDGAPAEGTRTALRAAVARAGAALRADGVARCAAAGGVLAPWLALLHYAARRLGRPPPF
jgi:hypothetical protein